MKNEPLIRFLFFFGILIAMGLWEFFSPRRQRTQPRLWRWLSNLGLLVINTLVVRAVLPLAVIGFAWKMQSMEFGLFNVVHWPAWLEVVLSLAILDFVIYLQHVLFHRLPFLWRFHSVHHMDLDLDATSGVRFHTIEILISLGIKLAAVAGCGISALAVLIFEIVLNATSLFNHANIKMPLWVDRILRVFVVTPDMHRVHHSIIGRETNSNFGFNFPWWDRLLGTYRAQPKEGHEGMTIGLSQYQDPKVEKLPWMLIAPFTKRPKEEE